MGRAGPGGAGGAKEALLKSRLQACVAGPTGTTRPGEQCGILDGDDSLRVVSKDSPEQSFEEVLAGAGLWSAGSARHGTGKCRPCSYVKGNTGCENGVTCEFCHFPHTGKNRKQISMSSRLYCKRFAEQLVLAYGSCPDQLNRAVQVSSSGSSYFASLFKDQYPDGSASATGVGSSDQPASSSTGEVPRKKIIVSL